jgi:hypothetical protein
MKQPIWTCAIALSVSIITYGGSIQFNLGDGTAYSGTNAPAALEHSVWNAPTGDVQSGLVYADGSPAPGISLDVGIDQGGTVDWNSMDNFRNSGNLTDGAGVYATSLMQKYWFGTNNGNLAVRVSGLKAGEYDVYVLVREHTEADRTYDVGVGVNSSQISNLSNHQISDASGVDTGDSWVEGLNYVKQRVSVNASADYITLVVDNTNQRYATLQGIQIVEVRPEPIGLITALGGCLMFIRLISERNRGGRKGIPNKVCALFPRATR